MSSIYWVQYKYISFQYMSHCLYLQDHYKYLDIYCCCPFAILFQWLTYLHQMRLNKLVRGELDWESHVNQTDKDRQGIDDTLLILHAGSVVYWFSIMNDDQTEDYCLLCVTFKTLITYSQYRFSCHWLYQ